MQHNSPIQQDLAADLIHDLINERRSDRRWKNIRFFLGLTLIVIILTVIFTQSELPVSMGDTGKGYVSLIRLNGMIGPGEDFSAETVLPILRDAFADPDTKGVVLDINSGGGTPVQASIIHDAIIELKKKYHKKVVVVGEDLMASGAYFVAVSADKIYVNPNSLTGSIGVIMKEFGFPDLIKKIGVERRVYAAGANKDRLDPFLPQTPEDVAKIHQIIDEVHANFEQAVLQGRAGKLHGDMTELFSGDFWSGQSALKLGLVDGLGNLSNVIQDEFHVTAYKDYSKSDAFLKSIVGKFGTSLDMAMSSSEQPKMLARV